MKNKLFLASILGGCLLLTGCTEMVLGSHMLKKATNNQAPYSAPPIKGNRKFGKPYTIMGKTYYPLSSSEGYRMKGVASWYGKDFHKKKTANGETYNMYAMTAAHPTLPLPTFVRVTNLENGRSTIVRVNDRGPFLRGRLIDMSYSGAVELGFMEQGTAPVLVEALPTDGSVLQPARFKQAPVVVAKPKEKAEPLEKVTTPTLTAGVVPPTPEKEKRGRFTDRVSAPKVLPTQEEPVMEASLNVEETDEVSVGNVHYFIQTGAFTGHENASNQKTKVETYYPNQASIDIAVVHARTFYRVRVGPFNSVKEADDALLKLVNSGFNTARIALD